MNNHFKQKIPLILIVGIMLTSLFGCSNIPKIDWELKITGAVQIPMTYSFTELTEMPQIDLDDIYMSKTYSKDETRSFAGIPLAYLLEQAGASPDMVSITAVAADGYAIEISLQEMQDGIVALKDGGKWIQDKEPESGPIRLV
ncbi:MAG: molybdopterin-dependent oxidoreductase, partial [Chloroflexota bacterium]